jgi:hypothetical protein
MNTINNTGKWSDISATLNANFNLIAAKLSQLDNVAWKCLGIYNSLTELKGVHPNAPVGSYAYVGTDRYTLYVFGSSGWYPSVGGLTIDQILQKEFDLSEVPDASLDERGLMTIAQVKKLADLETLIGEEATEEKPGLMSTNHVKTLKELGQTTAEISKKVIESVDVSELDGLVAIPTPTNGKADYWLTKMSGGIPIIIGRVFLFEDNMLHKVTQVVMSNQKIDDYYPDGSHAEESLTVYYRFYGHNTVDVPLKQWTPWKKLYDSEDMSPDEIETAISELQLKDKEHDDELQVIGNRVTTEINSIRSSTPVFANIVAGDVDLELSSVTSNYTVVYLENKKVFAALNAGKYWANWRAWGKYPSADSYGPAPAVGKVYIMGNALYVWNGSSLQEIGDFDDIKNNVQAIDLLAEEVATKQQELTLTVLDNGNIRIGNLQGQTKDFMPATPSGDPMHEAYRLLGGTYNRNAVYNNDANTIKQTLWESLVDDADYNAKWGINVIPDNATFVKTLKFNGVDREVWEFDNPLLSNRKVWAVAEYASDGTKIWDDKVYVSRGGMWSLASLGDLTNADMRKILLSPYVQSTEGSCGSDMGRVVCKLGTKSNAMIPQYFLSSQRSEVLLFGYAPLTNSTQSLSCKAFVPYSYFVISHNITATAMQYCKMICGKSVTMNVPKISARSVIYLLNKTSSTITITFPSALYDRLMDTSTTLGTELVALLETKSNITFARGE